MRPYIIQTFEDSHQLFFILIFKAAKSILQNFVFRFIMRVKRRKNMSPFQVKKSVENSREKLNV